MYISYNLRIIFVSLVLFLFFYGTEAQNTNTYTENVGNILFNSQTDNINFSLTGETIRQYYNFFPGAAFKDEKSALISYYKQWYTDSISIENGYITIRFIVNYKGETDRFRVQQMDYNYKEKAFSGDIAQQLLEITKSIQKWKIAKVKGKKYDYFQYLTFVIEEGNIKEILP